MTKKQRRARLKKLVALLIGTTVSVGAFHVGVWLGSHRPLQCKEIRFLAGDNSGIALDPLEPNWLVVTDPAEIQCKDSITPKPQAPYHRSNQFVAESRPGGAF